jgi:hypothetical protein
LIFLSLQGPCSKLPLSLTCPPEETLCYFALDVFF